MRSSIQASETIPSFASQKDPLHSEATISLPTRTADETTKVRTAAPALSVVSSYESNQSNLIQAKKSSGDIRHWYR